LAGKVNSYQLEVEKYANENVVRVLVGNKVDLESKREVTFEEGKELADSLNIRFIGNCLIIAICRDLS